MNNLYKRPLASVLGIIAIGAVIGFGLTGCPTNEEDEEEDGGSKISAIDLTLNEWANGQIVQGGEQWFKFTATTGSQYIHVYHGTLRDLYVQLHDSAGKAVGGSTNFYSYGSLGKYVNLSVTSGRVYYLKVWPSSSSSSGTYKIAFTASVVTPDEIAAMASAPTLTADTWEQKQLAVGGEHWFKFTATAGTQYIHVYRGTLRDLYVQLRDSSGNAMGGSTNFYGSPDSKYVNLLVTSGAVYYLRVWPYSSSDSGSYKIGFNTSTTAPAD
jgi:hypothetical protein